MLKNMLDLRGKVKSQERMLGVHRAHDAHRMARPVEKIGIAECDVPGAGSRQVANVLEHAMLRNQEKSTLIYRYDRTMQAMMQASAARFDVSHFMRLTVALKMGVS